MLLLPLLWAGATAAFPFRAPHDLLPRDNITSDSDSWQIVAADKQSARASLLKETGWLVPPELLPSNDTLDVTSWAFTSGWFTDLELEITEATASDVVERIASGEWTATQVLEAVGKRTVAAQQLVNPLTEIAFDRAFQRAAELDAHFEQTGCVVGPLHGLPISLKDQFQLKGLDSTIGYVSFANKPADVDSTLVSALEAAGAIPGFVKTNIPPGLMADVTVNNLFGRTVNPFNRGVGTGGSSGGEGALVGSHASFIGVGTDIGGSIRFPAINAGLWGLRPSVGRCSYQRVANSLRGQEAVQSTCGPLGRSPADLRLFMSTLAAQNTFLQDPVVLPIPWREEQEQLPEKLSFGWTMGDGAFQPAPPLQRAMYETRKALEALGHEVVEYIPAGLPEAQALVTSMFRADGSVQYEHDIDSSGEPWIPQVLNLMRPVPEKERPTVNDSWALVEQRQRFATQFLADWEETKNITCTGRPIDALIMPVQSFPALPNEFEDDLPAGYANLSPMLDLTTGVFPVTRVDPAIDTVNASFVPISDADKNNQAKYDDPERWRNVPVGLQLIGRRLEEEKIVTLLEVVQKALKK